MAWMDFGKSTSTALHKIKKKSNSDNGKCGYWNVNVVYIMLSDRGSYSTVAGQLGDMKN